MATYVTTKIYEALATKLAALTFTPSIPVIWPNVAPATPPAAGTTYISASFQPNTVEQITAGDNGMNRHRGLFQINVYAPENNGLTQGLEIAGAVAAHFPRGTVLTTGSISLHIDRPPVVSAPLKDGAYILHPVTVAYMVDASN